MDFNEPTQPDQPQQQQADQSQHYLNDIAGISRNMVGWLKFLGVMSIIYGVIAAITIIGILIAWLPIWMGVLLFQAGNQINEAGATRNNYHLVTMMQKLKTFFVIQGITVLIMLILGLISFLVSGAAIFNLLNSSSY